MTRAQLRAVAAPVARDLAGVGGAAMVAIGAGEIYAPAGLIVGGLLLATAAILSAARAG